MQVVLANGALLWDLKGGRLENHSATSITQITDACVADPSALDVLTKRGATLRVCTEGAQIARTEFPVHITTSLGHGRKRCWTMATIRLRNSPDVPLSPGFVCRVAWRASTAGAIPRAVLCSTIDLFRLDRLKTRMCALRLAPDAPDDPTTTLLMADMEL